MDNSLFSQDEGVRMVVKILSYTVRGRNASSLRVYPHDTPMFSP